MSILIKGMEMPTNCMDCPFKGFDRAGGRGNICTINDSITLHAVLDGVDVKFVRMGDCPRVPVPSHGDLIDRGALHKLFEDQWHYLQVLDWNENPTAEAKQSGINWCINTMHDDAPTIIPAEGGET